MKLVKEFFYPIGRGRRGKFKVFEIDGVEQDTYTNRAGEFMSIKVKNGRSFSGAYDESVFQMQSENPNMTILYESSNGLIVCCMPGAWKQVLKEDAVYKSLRKGYL